MNDQHETTDLIAEADRAYRGGQLKRALTLYEQVLSLDPENAWACSRAGAILAQQGNLDQAEVMFERALEIDPNLPQAHSNLGNLYFSRGDYAEALKKYETAVSLSPETPVFHENLHAAHKKLGNMAQAVKSLKTAHRLEREATKNEAKATLKGGLTRRLGCFGSTIFAGLVTIVFVIWVV